MIATRIVVPAALAAFFLAVPLWGQDLSTYRDFHLGMRLPEVLKAIGNNSSRLTEIQKRPDLVQQVDWQLERYSFKSLDPVSSMLFSFCNGELFQISVRYDRGKTMGLTSEDLIESISEKYGTATRPDVDLTFPTSEESVKVIARWEDAQYSFNLVRFSYQTNLGIIAFSKHLDTSVRASIAEARRLDTQEAPQKELEAKKKLQAADDLALEKARTINKPNFLP